MKKFTKCLNEYFTYLNMQNTKISGNHQLEISVRSIDNSISIKVYNEIHFFSNLHTKNIYNNLNDKLFTLSY